MQGGRTAHAASGSAREEREPTLTLRLSAVVLDALAERVAARVNELLQAPRPVSPWLDFEAACAYLRFSSDQLYKLTAAKAIPFRKKRDGQGLLFHQAELDRWLEATYEPTGCSTEAELWSSATQ
jgi:excisionase family DNA binding protein